MNKYIRTSMALFAIGITSAALPAFASEPFHVTVPFAFRAGATSLPAGDYTVVEESSHVVMLRGTRGSAILLATAGPDTDRDKSALNFARTDKGYFLKAVHSYGRPTSVLRISPIAEQ
jgi:hypothetical protein